MSLKVSRRDGSTLAWRKSTYSSNDGPACVEVAATPGVVRVRDSKDIGLTSLGFSAETWSRFVADGRGR